jgi:hypothetical protein
MVVSNYKPSLEQPRQTQFYQYSNIQIRIEKRKIVEMKR